MGNNNFLIPANSKKSMLILGFFNKIDLIIFGTGILITLIFMFSVSVETLKGAIIVLLPALISTFLILPIPNQHNVITMLTNIYRYFTNRRTYYWKGWCVKYGKDETK